MGNVLVSNHDNIVVQKKLDETSDTEQDCIFEIDDRNTNHKHEFTICSFNIWCPFWNGTNGKESEYPQRWKKRHADILNILSNKGTTSDNGIGGSRESQQPERDVINADIYCIQEFWCDNKEFVELYETYLKPRNYTLVHLKRGSERKPDGLAMLINTSVFRINNKLDFEYQASDRVAIIMELQHIQSGANIVIGNTHFTFPDRCNASLRKSQCIQFISLMDKTTKTNASLMIVCGDYNCDIHENEAVLCSNKGYQSSFHVVNNKKDGKHISHLTHKQETVFVDHIMYKRNVKVKEENKFGVKVVDSYLYPRDVTNDKWPNKEEYNLSDHRPIVSTFQIQKI